jgi:hypothetical protein
LELHVWKVFHEKEYVNVKRGGKEGARIKEGGKKRKGDNRP